MTFPAPPTPSVHAELPASLEVLVAEAHRAVAAAGGDAARIVAALVGPMRRAAAANDWFDPARFVADPEQGFGSYLLHEDEGHAIALFVVVWAPGRGAPAHDHGTWGVVGGVRGAETNVAFERTDDGTEDGVATLREIGKMRLGPGDVVTVLPADIHSVVNETAEPTASLHLYGRHLGFTPRSEYDPAAGIRKPFIVRFR